MRTHSLRYWAVIAAAAVGMTFSFTAYAQTAAPDLVEGQEQQTLPAPPPADTVAPAPSTGVAPLPDPPQAASALAQPVTAPTVVAPPVSASVPASTTAPVVLPATLPAAPVAIGTTPVSANAATVADPQPASTTAPADWESVLTKPGSYVWQPELAPEGQVLIVVSLTEQRAHVYRDGVRIAITTISSGSKGRETPTGSFEILQKKVMHRSNLYDDAPMPFMQRLTWDGIALHAGRIPGYPASHGCIRLPRKFAELLYGATNFGSRVLVADSHSDPTGFLIHPGPTAPLDVITGVPQGAYAQALGELTNRYAMPMLSQAALDPSKPLREQLQAGRQPQAAVPANHSGVPAFAKPIWHNGDDPAKRVGQAPLILVPQKAATAIGTTAMPPVPAPEQEAALREQEQGISPLPPAAGPR